ncbi:MAG TPA: ERF family protein [Candidatus Sulfotelmatobacter sp.]|nr:ERF family protein [Candidatus Sulfotelmatobacter sp.]
MTPQQEELFVEPIQRTFWHSDQINEIAAALAKAQATIPGAIKESTNPHFKSKYADLASVWEACRKHLTANGIAVIQMPAGRDAETTVTTMLVHSSGQFFASSLTLRAIDDRPQSLGSAITYARRYALAAMAGVAPEDDDGNAASGRGQTEQAERRTERAAPKPPQADLTIPHRTSPLQDTFDRLGTALSKPAPTTVKSALELLRQSMEEKAGEIGMMEYNRVYGEYEKANPKGTHDPRIIINMLRDLWRAMEAIEAVKA